MSDILLDVFKKSMYNSIELFKKHIPLEIIVCVIEELLYEYKSSLTTCRGCIENQANQQAHMDYGGCMFDDNV